MIYGARKKKIIAVLPIMNCVCVCVCVCFRLQRAWQQVYHLALQCFNVPSVASASVCFCELLGGCSLKLRVDVRALNAILQHWNHRDTHTAPTQHVHTLGKHKYTHTQTCTSITQHVNMAGSTLICLFSVSKGLKLVEAESGAAEELIGYLEAAVTDTLEQKGISR